MWHPLRENGSGEYMFKRQIDTPNLLLRTNFLGWGFDMRKQPRAPPHVIVRDSIFPNDPANVFPRTKVRAQLVLPASRFRRIIYLFLTQWIVYPPPILTPYCGGGRTDQADGPDRESLPCSQKEVGGTKTNLPNNLPTTNNTKTANNNSKNRPGKLDPRSVHTIWAHDLGNTLCEHDLETAGNMKFVMHCCYVLLCRMSNVQHATRAITIILLMCCEGGWEWARLSMAFDVRVLDPTPPPPPKEKEGQAPPSLWGERGGGGGVGGRGRMFIRLWTFPEQ